MYQYAGITYMFYYIPGKEEDTYGTFQEKSLRY